MSSDFTTAPPTPFAWRVGLVALIAVLAGGAYLLEGVIGTRGRALVGAVCFILLVAIFSSNLRAVNWRTVLTGLALQILLVLFVLRLGFVRQATPEMVAPHAAALIGLGPSPLNVAPLTGFANFSSIGIQLGGIGAMAPSRRADLARLGWRALLAGFAATLVNASLAAVLLE